MLKDPIKNNSDGLQKKSELRLQNRGKIVKKLSLKKSFFLQKYLVLFFKVFGLLMYLLGANFFAIFSTILKPAESSLPKKDKCFQLFLRTNFE
jgi:hypothetical protein